MRYLSGLGLGLSVIFACLFFVLVAEIYYLWWKKRFSKNKAENCHGRAERQLFFVFREKMSSSSSQKPRNLHEPEDIKAHEPETRLQVLPSKEEFLVKPFEEEEEDDDLEAMRLQVPPRFLFTIAEETKEDLESEEVIFAVETPFFTPLSSPSFLTPLTYTESYKQNGLNTLCESLSDAEFDKIRTSPPPKFKCLQDAEEKRKRKLMEEVERGVVEEDGSCPTVMAKDQKEFNHQPCFTHFQN